MGEKNNCLTLSHALVAPLEMRSMPRGSPRLTRREQMNITRERTTPKKENSGDSQLRLKQPELAGMLSWPWMSFGSRGLSEWWCTRSAAAAFRSAGMMVRGQWLSLNRCEA